MFVVKQVDLGSLKLFFAKCEWNRKRTFFFRRILRARYSDKFPLDNAAYAGLRNFIAVRDQRAQATVPSSHDHASDRRDLPWQLSWIAEEIILDHTTRGWIHLEGSTWPSPEIVEKSLQPN